jgi:hypothetical protein
MTLSSKLFALLFAWVALFPAVAVRSSKSANSVSALRRHLELVNQSNERVAVDWINPDTGESVPFYTGVNPGQRLALDSFVNHTFLIRYPTNATASCSAVGIYPELSPTYVTVTEEREQVIVVKEGLLVENEQPTPSESSELVRLCRKQALDFAKDPTAALQVLTTCLEDKLATILQEKNAELAFQAELRTSLSRTAENYTCADQTKETTTPQQVRKWTHEGVTRQAQILHNRPSSQIHVVTDFISPQECKAILEAAASTLNRGTVADGKGGSRLSENRKAWQAGVKVDWSTDNAIAIVSRRLFDYANHVTGYNMTVDGQEDLMSSKFPNHQANRRIPTLPSLPHSLTFSLLPNLAVQYFGNGLHDKTPDRYMPHCDGDCDGLPHKTGGRVATMVMYCDVPEIGGGTNFQNSNVFVKPQVGAAAFFSYLNPETQIHEQGFTTHSGCPVLEGTKRIAVQWMRIGVDSGNPWDSFDTLTISKKGYESMDSA